MPANEMSAEERVRAVYPHLRVWRGLNGNGTQAGVLITSDDAGKDELGRGSTSYIPWDVLAQHPSVVAYWEEKKKVAESKSTYSALPETKCEFESRYVNQWVPQTPDEGFEEWSKRKIGDLVSMAEDGEVLSAEKLALAKFAWSAALAWKGEKDA